MRAVKLLFGQQGYHVTLALSLVELCVSGKTMSTTDPAQGPVTDSVTTMCVDTHRARLYAGDDSGSIHAWDIAQLMRAPEFARCERSAQISAPREI